MRELEEVACVGHPAPRRHAYRCSGLGLAASCRIPGLSEDCSGAPPDLTVDLAPRASAPSPASSQGRLWRVHPVADASGRPVVVVRRTGPDERFHLTYADGTEFAVDRRGRHVRGSWAAPFTLEDAVTYLVGPVLGFALRLHGRLALHASAVAIDGRAVLFLGASGAGKSTLAAALARRGHPVLCDDAAALVDDGERLLVQPGSARLRLWPDAAEALFGAAEHLPLLTPNWDKRYFDAARVPGLFCERAAPLAAMYMLEPAGRDAGVVTPRETLHALLAHSYVGYLQDAPMRAREFDKLAELAGRVRLRRLHRAGSAGRIGELCDRVVRDARRAAAA